MSMEPEEKRGPGRPRKNEEDFSRYSGPRNVPLWTFYYHQGSAHKQGVVEARDEATAMHVATKWCVLNGNRPPASVQPLILATEEILTAPVPQAEELMSVVDVVSATTSVNVNAR